MRFWRRLVDDTLVVAVTPGTDMVLGFYWFGTTTGRQDKNNRVRQHRAAVMVSDGGEGGSD